MPGILAVLGAPGGRPKTHHPVAHCSSCLHSRHTQSHTRGSRAWQSDTAARAPSGALDVLPQQNCLESIGGSANASTKIKIVVPSRRPRRNSTAAGLHSVRVLTVIRALLRQCRQFANFRHVKRAYDPVFLVSPALLKYNPAVQSTGGSSCLGEPSKQLARAFGQ